MTDDKPIYRIYAERSKSTDYGSFVSGGPKKPWPEPPAEVPYFKNYSLLYWEVDIKRESRVLHYKIIGLPKKLTITYEVVVSLLRQIAKELAYVVYPRLAVTLLTEEHFNKVFELEYKTFISEIKTEPISISSTPITKQSNYQDLVAHYDAVIADLEENKSDACACLGPTEVGLCPCAVARLVREELKATRNALVNFNTGKWPNG